MKRKSIVLSLICLFWGLYVVYSVFFYYYTYSEVLDQEIDRRLMAVDSYSQIGTSLLELQEFGKLYQILELARIKGDIDFFSLRTSKSGEVIFSGAKEPEKLLATNLVGKGNNVTIAEGVGLKTVQIRDLNLLIGSKINKSFLISRNFIEGGQYIIRDVLIVTFFTGILFYLVLKNILDLSRLVSSNNRNGLRTIQVKSIEAARIRNASIGASANAAKLGGQIQAMSHSQIPAVAVELNKNLPVPREIRCCVVRIDMNGYTSLFMNASPEKLVEYLNGYFYFANEIIGRYGGKIYQYLGDEIIFLFVDDHDSGLVKRAFACLQALMNQLEGLKHEGSSLFNKGSLSLGALEFLMLDKGYFFLGEPLIESVRLLSLIDEKDKNTVCFRENVAGYLQDFSIDSTARQVKLKGYEEDTVVHFTSRFVGLKDLPPANHNEVSSFFRSDSDIIHIMEMMVQNQAGNNKDRFIQLYQFLKSFPVSGGSEDFRKKGTEIICFQMAQDLESEKEVFFSCWVSLLSHLFENTGVDERALRQLKDLCSCGFPRVVANSLNSLSHFEKNHHFYKPFLVHSHARVQSEALVILGRKKINRRIIDLLKRLIGDELSNKRKAGLLAAEKLLRHYQDLDPIYYHSNDNILELRRLLKKADIRKIERKTKPDIQAGSGPKAA